MKKPIPPLIIFSLSIIGSLILTTIGTNKGLYEGNPIMRYFLGIHPIFMWVFGILVIGLVWIVYWYNRGNVKKFHLVGYWILAVVLLVNFVRELVMFIIFYSH